MTQHNKPRDTPLPGCVQLWQFRVAEVGLRQARVEVRHLEVHSSLSEKISPFFLPTYNTGTVRHNHGYRLT